MSTSAKRLSRSVQGDLARDGLLFVPNVLADPHFLAAGVANGRDHDCWWAVVDPLRHPLGVWKKRVPRLAVYGRSAQALEAAIFTNGPMMGKCYPQIVVAFTCPFGAKRYTRRKTARMNRAFTLQ
jgi:hypothetical protein